MSVASGIETGVCQTNLVHTSTINIYASHHAKEADGVKGSFVLTRTGQLSQPVTVSYVIAGSATASDYQPIPATLRFEAGQSEKSLIIQAVDDGFKEKNETVSLTLNPETGYVIGNHHSDLIQIIDNDSGANQPAENPGTADQPEPDQNRHAGFFKPRVAGPVITQQQINSGQLRPIPTVNGFGLLLMMICLSWVAGFSSKRNKSQ
ncbi:MAG: hypothetical protein K0U68_15615 [Gammaproteobacteria bacterium]|nr:hypothetical protein [Gammaproteobacteria bacterium]